MKKYRIANKLRFTVFMTTVILLSVVCISALLGFSDASASENLEYLEYYVESGDTLWNIASDYRPSDMSIKEFIYEISSHNNTDASHLQAGQVIEIPIYND